MKQELVKFIELDRKFRKLLPNEKPEEAAIESYTRSLLGHDSSLGWKELFEYRLVVVLGEPGSGKTWEFRERAKILEAKGDMAFFIHLDRLITQPLIEIFNTEEYNKFQNWLLSNQRAIFFLDSVDEAKYQKTSDFLAALDNFRKVTRNNCLTRMHLFVSSRISEWRPQSDAHELISRFPLPPLPKSKNRPAGTDTSDVTSGEQDGLLIVKIEPLDRSRVERFMRDMGVNDPASFIRALDENYAWQFARRPIDVIDLINYWKAHNKLGSLTELIEHNLSQNLKETIAREKQDRLTSGKARQGAEALGAAVTFCRNFNFSVPDDAHLAETAAIDSSACLPEDWNTEERYALLNRSIFDSASYGQIRFHHRRMAEYLAAQWLATRMKEGCSIYVLNNLLFAEIKNKKVIRPSLSPITAWLSSGEERWNEDVRNSVLEAAPWLHLQYGDPKLLPLEYKRKLLKALVERYEGRDRIWIDAEPESLSRLADPGLADDVAEIIRNRNVSLDIRIEMLRLVRHGRLVGCLNAVLDIIAAPEESNDLKLYAVAAVRDIADRPHLMRLWELVKCHSLIPTKLCAYICEALYPKIINAEDLVDILCKSDEVPRYAVDLPYYLRRHLENVITPETSGDLLARLNQLCQQPPYVQRDHKDTLISDRFYWVGEVIPTVIKKLFDKSQLTEQENNVAAESLWLLGRLRYDGMLEKHDLNADFDTLTSQHPRVRQCYFGHLVEERRRKKKKEDLSHPIYFFGHFDILKLMTADLEWAISDIKNFEEKADQIIALKMAIELWNISGRKWRDRRRIRHATVSNSVLLTWFRQNAKYGPLVWMKSLWYRYFKYKFACKWWWKRRFQPIQQSYIWLRDQWTFLRNIRLLSSGKATNWLSYLAGEAGRENSSLWAPQTWEKLEQKRGRLIAQAARTGCKRVWKQFIPLLPHEKPNSSQTDNRVIVGLAGLQAEFADNELYSTQLTEEEAHLAVRYAVNELSGFAPWLPELAKHWPQAVCAVFSECIRGEWQFDAKREHVHEVLSDLVWQGEGLIHLVKDILLSELQFGDPPNTSILETVLTLLLREADPPVVILSEMAAERVRQYPSDSYCFILWLAVWLQLDAKAALKFLQETLQKSPDADNVMIRLCSMLHYDSRHHLPLVSSPNYVMPIILRNFIPLVYRHVRPSEDINRAGTGTYSPSARDHAQEFRGGLLKFLSQSECAQADDVLVELLQEPNLAHLHDYILHILDDRAEKQVELPVWDPKDIRTFEKDYEIDPKTDQYLFKIACRRLRDIKHDVELSDDSIRTEMHKEDEERVLRIWLARKLKDRARSRYTVPQEEEIDRRERPDLRLENPKTQPVSIEIKWAENWTLEKLLERLENQLVGQYMRDNNSCYGIYLLCYIGKRNEYPWKDKIKQSRLSFDQVIKIIEEHAKTIVKERSDIGDISVTSIDFTDPR